MADINISEIRHLTLEANDSRTLQEIRFPYQDSYKVLNELLVDAAKSGKNHISFDFINSDSESKKDAYRIYPEIKEWTYAIYDVFDYPNYLLSKGFNVEIRKSQKSHGYCSLSYFISW